MNLSRSRKSQNKSAHKTNTVPLLFPDDNVIKTAASNRAPLGGAFGRDHEPAVFQIPWHWGGRANPLHPPQSCATGQLWTRLLPVVRPMLEYGGKSRIAAPATVPVKGLFHVWTLEMGHDQA